MSRLKSAATLQKIMRLKVFICLLLAGITLALYWPASHFTLIAYDDGYFLKAPQVATGLSPEGIDWAMKAVVASNWHPITTSSFLLMHEFFGFDPGAEHLVNILLHAANVVLLFLVLYEMTARLDEPPLCNLKGSPSPLPSPAGRGSSLWKSAIVAAIFAWHPLHVESVAWIAERKDVLFTFFMLLSLWCYVRYAQANDEKPPSAPLNAARTAQRAVPATDPERAKTLTPSPPRGRGSAAGFLSPHAYYNWALVFFILSFLCKAMVVTLPFILLLLDYWPLRRLYRSTLRGLIFEKWRFFALMIFFCILTFRFQKSAGAVISLNHAALPDRLENTVLSYANYLGKLFWPANLAFPYPFPESFNHVQVLLTALLLLAITAWCILQISRRPYLAMGWFWYVGTMVPVIGLVQVGPQGMADRYTYITLIGPSISLVWLVGEWVRNSSFWKYLAISATAVLLAVWAVLTEKELQYWKDTITLSNRAIEVTQENAVAERALAQSLEEEGLLSQAAVHYRLAIASRQLSDHYMADFYLAGLMAQMGHYREAEARLEAALQIDPNATEAMNNLAWTLATSPDAKARNGARAVELAKQACELTHYQNPTFMTTLATAYAEAGRFDDAVDMIQKAITLANQYDRDDLAAGDQELLDAYSAHQTYAQTHPAPQTIEGK